MEKFPGYINYGISAKQALKTFLICSFFNIIMKKGAVIVLLLGALLISPLIQAQNQSQTYSGFDRFIDNVRMFFTFGDGKVILSLEIREKELNSAIINTKNGNDEEAEKNLERARERLQYVQSQVSKTIAEDVKINVNETINRINEEGNLSESFEVYVLEEEKTQLTAELVIEFEGKEGQNLTREIVKDNVSGENKVEIVIEGDKGEKVMEIEGEIAGVDNQIAEWVVKTDVAGGNSGDDGLTPEVKTGSGANGNDNVVDEGPGEPGVVDED